MARPHATALLVLLAGLAAGCTREQAADAGPPLASVDAGAVEWRGSLHCADCEAIDTRLVLDRSDGAQRYELREVYVAADGSVDFEEAGEWRMHHSLLSLEADDGGLRRFGLVGGGALQQRAASGRAIPGREGDVLEPVGHPH